MDLLSTHDSVTSRVGHLENIVSLSYADFAMLIHFSMQYQKFTIVAIITIPSEESV